MTRPTAGSAATGLGAVRGHAAAVVEHVIEFWAHAVPPYDQERT